MLFFFGQWWYAGFAGDQLCWSTLAFWVGNPGDHILKDPHPMIYMFFCLCSVFLMFQLQMYLYLGWLKVTFDMKVRTGCGVFRPPSCGGETVSVSVEWIYGYVYLVFFPCWAPDSCCVWPPRGSVCEILRGSGHWIVNESNRYDCCSRCVWVAFWTVWSSLKYIITCISLLLRTGTLFTANSLPLSKISSWAFSMFFFKMDICCE